MIRTDNNRLTFLRNNLVWKLLVSIVGAAVVIGALAFQVRENWQRSSANSESIQHTRERVVGMERDIAYIRQAVERIERRLDDAG